MAKRGGHGKYQISRKASRELLPEQKKKIRWGRCFHPPQKTSSRLPSEVSLILDFRLLPPLIPFLSPSHGPFFINMQWPQCCEQVVWKRVLSQLSIEYQSPGAWGPELMMIGPQQADSERSFWQRVSTTLSLSLCLLDFQERQFPWFTKITLLIFWQAKT